MSEVTVSKVFVMHAGEVPNCAVSFIPLLESGELLTGTPTVVEVGTSHLTIASVAKNTATITIDGVSHAANQAVQFRISSGAVAGTTYILKVTCGTDASPAQTRIVKCKIKAKGD